MRRPARRWKCEEIVYTAQGWSVISLTLQRMLFTAENCRVLPIPLSGTECRQLTCSVIEGSARRAATRGNTSNSPPPRPLPAGDERTFAGPIHREVPSRGNGAVMGFELWPHQVVCAFGVTTRLRYTEDREAR